MTPELPTAQANGPGQPRRESLAQQDWQLEVTEPAWPSQGEHGSTPELPDTLARPAETAQPTSARPPEATVEPPSPLRIIEALLFVGGTPLTPERAAEVIRGLSLAQFEEAVHTLNQTYHQQGRPYQARKQDQGYVLALRPDYRFVIGKLYGGMREARLSTAAVEVLAVVAYRQPVTKQEVDSLRGHESAALLRQLLRRGLIAVAGRAESGGREVRYGTTPRFLELFGLRSLDDLPETEDLQRL
jgi:segregation and condensation protein B